LTGIADEQNTWGNVLTLGYFLFNFRPALLMLEAIISASAMER
jgi:hypothetical protein